MAPTSQLPSGGASALRSARRNPLRRMLVPKQRRHAADHLRGMLTVAVKVADGTAHELRPSAPDDNLDVADFIEAFLLEQRSHVSMRQPGSNTAIVLSSFESMKSEDPELARLLYDVSLQLLNVEYGEDISDEFQQALYAAALQMDGVWDALEECIVALRDGSLDPEELTNFLHERVHFELAQVMTSAQRRIYGPLVDEFRSEALRTHFDRRHREKVAECAYASGLAAMGVLLQADSMAHAWLGTEHWTTTIARETRHIGGRNAGKHAIFLRELSDLLLWQLKVSKAPSHVVEGFRGIADVVDNHCRSIPFMSPHQAELMRDDLRTTFSSIRRLASARNLTREEASVAITKLANKPYLRSVAPDLCETLEITVAQNMPKSKENRVVAGVRSALQLAQTKVRESVASRIMPNIGRKLAGVGVAIGVTVAGAALTAHVVSSSPDAHEPTDPGIIGQEMAPPHPHKSKTPHLEPTPTTQQSPAVDDPALPGDSDPLTSHRPIPSSAATPRTSRSASPSTSAPSGVRPSTSTQPTASARPTADPSTSTPPTTKPTGTPQPTKSPSTTPTTHPTTTPPSTDPPHVDPTTTAPTTDPTPDPTTSTKQGNTDHTSQPDVSTDSSDVASVSAARPRSLVVLRQAAPDVSAPVADAQHVADLASLTLRPAVPDALTLV